MTFFGLFDNNIHEIHRVLAFGRPKNSKIGWNLSKLQPKMQKSLEFDSFLKLRNKVCPAVQSFVWTSMAFLRQFLKFLVSKLSADKKKN